MQPSCNHWGPLPDDEVIPSLNLRAWIVTASLGQRQAKKNPIFMKAADGKFTRANRKGSSSRMTKADQWSRDQQRFPDFKRSRAWFSEIPALILHLPILAVSKKSTLSTFRIFTHSSILHPHVRAKCVGLVLICWKTVSNEIGMSQGNSYFIFHLILSSFAVFKHRDGASVYDHILGCRKRFLAQLANNEPTIPRFPNMMACATLFASKKLQHRINHYSLLQ